MVVVLISCGVVACVQVSCVCICCVPLYNYVKLLHPRAEINSNLGHSSQNKIIVYLSLIDLCSWFFHLPILCGSLNTVAKVYTSRPPPPKKNVFCLRFWPDNVHVELLCHKLRFIRDFCANGSLWNHLFYTQWPIFIFSCTMRGVGT